MRLLPSGSTALLAELDDLDAVLALYAAVVDDRPPGVVDVVPAARTVLLVVDTAVTTLEKVAAAVRNASPRPGRRTIGSLLEVPVTYDGEDLHEVADLLHCTPEDVVRRHVAQEWTVAFCGFAPGFGYLAATEGSWDVPRRDEPRTAVPPGSVALAGPFSGVYPRASPGGWQLIGRTDLAVFDPSREPAALLRPGVRVQFLDVT
jgi:KipI family sensor histidine kinase inhibitor